MRKFIGFFIKNPIWSNSIIVVTAIAGLISMFTMHRSFFPEMDPDKIYVNVAYPGASPEEIEEGITTRIEEALIGIEGIKETTSKSKENISSITIEAYEGTNLNDLLQDVKNAVDGINSFPTGAERPIVTAQKTSGMGFVAILALKGPDDLWKLKEMSDKIERDLLGTEEISQIQVLGYPPIIMGIDIHEEDLLRYGLTFDQVATVVSSSNIDLSAGTVKTNKEELYIRSMQKTTDPKLLENIIVATQADGQQIKLKDIADVNLDFSDVALKSYINKKRSVTFIVNKLPAEDLKDIAHVIEDYQKTFNKENEGYELVTMFQFSDMLDQRIDMLSSNLMLGLFLVLLVLGFFLSLRLSLWVAFGIPFSFIGMFALGAMYGMTINMISLFGMIVVVGILVDDGIVIAENIYSHYERGKSAMRAALDGTLEVLPSVFTSILTTIVAFGFLLFVGGDMEMMEEMAFSVVACLTFSMVEAFLVLPAHLSHGWVLKPVEIGWYGRIRSKIEKGIAKTRDAYGRFLSKTLKRYRWMVWGPVVFIFMIIFFSMSGIIRFTFFPSIPFDSIQLEIAFKPGERDIRTENFLWYCDSIVSDYRDELFEQYGDTIIETISINMGSTESLGESGSHTGSIRVTVKENQKLSTKDMAIEIKNRIHPDSIKQLEKISVGGEERFGKPISISLQSDDNKQLKEASEWLKSEIKDIPLVKDLIDNSGIGNREVHIKLKPQAHLLGLNEMIIANQIRQGFFGQEVQRLIVGRDEVKVWVRYPEHDRNSMGDLDNMKIKTTLGQEFPLTELVSYEIVRGKVAINHLNGKTEIRIYGDLFDNEKASDVNNLITETLYPQLEEKFPDVIHQVKGQAERANDSSKRLGASFILAIFLIILILSLNFSSLYQARLIMMVIPVGIASALLGHGIEGKPFSTLSFWGVIALVGILVNDAVVMLDQYNRNLKDGMNPIMAVTEAGKSRFRAIILTSITTVVGLYPLIMEKSFQAQFLIPMAISVAYGVLFGTMVLLFFFPSLILYFNDMRRTWFWLWRGGKTPPTKLEVEPVMKIEERHRKLKEHDI